MVVDAAAWGSLSAADRPIEGHDGGDDSVDLLRGLLLIWLNVSGRVGAHVNVIDLSLIHI